VYRHVDGSYTFVAIIYAASSNASQTQAHGVPDRAVTHVCHGHSRGEHGCETDFKIPNRTGWLTAWPLTVSWPHGLYLVLKIYFYYLKKFAISVKRVILQCTQYKQLFNIGAIKI
jgi:hypothetical protein